MLFREWSGRTLAPVGAWVGTVSLHVGMGGGASKGSHHPHVVSRTNCGYKKEKRHLRGVWGLRTTCL